MKQSHFLLSILLLLAGTACVRAYAEPAARPTCGRGHQSPCPTPSPSPSSSPAPTGCVGVNVPASADLVAYESANAPGTTYCLAAGTYMLSGLLRADGGDVFWGAGKTATLIDLTNVSQGTGCTWVNGCRVIYRDLSVGNSGGSGLMAEDLVMMNVRCFNNALTCVGGGSSQVGLLMDNVECDGNGFAANQFEINNACIKMQWGQTIIVRNSYIHDNPGAGLWFDFCGHPPSGSTTPIGCQVTIENNTITHNGLEGILWEVSGNFKAGDHATVRYNTIQNNGWNTANYNGVAALTDTDSSNLEAYQNIFGGNLYWPTNTGPVTCCRGFVAWEGTRDPAAMYNVTIHDNTMNGDTLIYCAPSNPGVTCTNNV
jgi:hypothetical protein